MTRAVQFLVAGLVLLTVSCATLAPFFQDSDLSPASTPTPQLQGISRAFPYPAGTRATSPDWTVEALEFLRGEQAWERLRAANMFNEPPPEGQAYVLLKLAVKSATLGLEEYHLQLFMTGDEGLVYRGFPATPPKPRLEYDFRPTEKKTGWRAFLIREGESNLLLGFRSSYDIDAPNHYLALEDEARIFVDMALDEIEPTDLGTVSAWPAPLGDTVTTEDWQVTIERVLWDEAAWNALLEANQFNDPPPENRRYLLARIRVRYIGMTEGPELIGGYDFSVTGGDEKVFDPPALVEPKPVLNVYLFPGGTFTGWLAMETDRFVETPVLIFDPSYKDSEVRYLDLNAP
jgi:hypothetical protein